MSKITILLKMYFILLLVSSVFSSEFDKSFNFTLNDEKAILDELRIDFSYLNNNKISPENSIYIYIENQFNDINIIWDSYELESMLKKTRTTLYQIKTSETQINDINGNYDILDKEEIIVPLKKIVPTPLASAMYNACTKDGSIIGPRINPIKRSNPVHKTPHITCT